MLPPTLYILVKCRKIFRCVLLLERELMRHNKLLRLPDPINTCLQLLIPMLAKEIPHHCLQFRLLISVHIKDTPLLQILQVEVVLVLFFQLVELSAISNPFHSLEVFVL